MKELLIEYKKWAETVQSALRKDTFWSHQYKGYAKAMINDTNRERYTMAKKKFHVRRPLHAYLTIGEVDKNPQTVSFDLRYLGQSVGTIKIKNDTVLLTVTKSQAENSRLYFGYPYGDFKEKLWSGSSEAGLFRSFFENDKTFAETRKQGSPHSSEHMVESALFSEFEKKSSLSKTLKNIQPVSYAGVRIHMKTAVMASQSGKKDAVYVSKTGGEIDCLCRRNVKPGTSRLCVIEIKDENKNSESFDKAMKQAISYAVFLRELIRSESGPEWKNIWGMGNQYTDTVAIDAVVAMPEGATKPSYNGERIEFDNGDFIELHYIEIINEITPDNSEDVVFNSSYLK